MFAPISPYQSTAHNLAQRGTAGLIEFPMTVTPLVRLPFFATFLLATGFTFFKRCYQSLKNLKLPIQYQFHLSDFVDYSHPDLAANIWTNGREIPGNGVDDDGNGFKDDVHGCSTVGNTEQPLGQSNGRPRPRHPCRRGDRWFGPDLYLFRWFSRDLRWNRSRRDLFSLKVLDQTGTGRTRWQRSSETPASPESP
jgi:hypothetical protein